MRKKHALSLVTETCHTLSPVTDTCHTLSPVTDTCHLLAPVTDTCHALSPVRHMPCIITCDRHMPCIITCGRHPPTFAILSFLRAPMHISFMGVKNSNVFIVWFEFRIVYITILTIRINYENHALANLCSVTSGLGREPNWVIQSLLHHLFQRFIRANIFRLLENNYKRELSSPKLCSK